jgi:hypothetical protein
MIFSSLKKALQLVFANKRMIIIFYVTNLLAGIVFILPLNALLSSYAGSSGMAKKLATGMDMDFLLEFMNDNTSFFSLVTISLFAISGIYWLFSLFLSGGAFQLFNEQKTYEPKLFWAGCGAYFGRFFRLSIMSLPVLFLFMLFPLIINGLQKLMFGSDPYQYITFWANALRIGLGYIGILLFSIVFDYSRIYTVNTDSKKMWRALLFGLKFSYSHFLKTFLLALVLFGIGLLFLALYNLISSYLLSQNGWIILMLFLTQQLYMIMRMVIRLWLYSGQCVLHQEISIG